MLPTLNWGRWHSIFSSNLRGPQAGAGHRGEHFLAVNEQSDPYLRSRLPQQELAAQARKDLGGILAPEERVLYAAVSDMSLQGTYADTWIVLTSLRILASTPQLSQTVQEVPLAEVTRLNVEHFVGNGILSAAAANQTVNLARFSRRFAVDIEKAVAEMEAVLEQEPVAANFVRTHDKAKQIQRKKMEKESNRCPNCGRIMKGSVCPHCLQKGKLIRRVLGYVKPYYPQAIVSTILLIGNGLLSMVQPFLTGLLVDEVLMQNDLGRLRAMVILLALTHLANAGVSGFRTYVVAWLGQRIIRDMRSAVFRHLQYLRMDFFDSVRTGAIMSRITNDTQSLQNFIVQSAQQLLLQVVMVFGVGVILFRYDWRLALMTLAPMPLIVYAARLFSRKMHRVYRGIWIRRALMNSVLADSIPGIQIVKSFAQEPREITKFEHRSDQLFGRHIDAAKYRGMFMPFLTFATSLGTVIIWGYGGYLVISNAGLSVGDLVAFLYYLNQFYNPLRGLSGFSDVIQQASTAAERVFEILDTEPEVKPESSEIVLKDVRGEIEYNDVHFAYDASEPVLQGINVKMKPGEMVGLVGSSGSGKTTMANLIPRLYDVSAGQVTLDGHDLRDIELQSLRNQIGVVLQEPLLFHGSVAENIAYGVPNASRSDIVWAAQAANAHDFIMEFSDKYDTQIGERGLRLSGGQKQRLAIARAILKNPKILILDEATSAVDTETEKLIQEAIERLVKNRTTIAIAHRLSTLKNADRILVMDKGRIVEQGTHEELMAMDGVFARMVKMQSEVSSNMLAS